MEKHQEIEYKTYNLATEGALQHGEGSYEDKLKSALNEFGKDGWALCDVIDRVITLSRPKLNSNVKEQELKEESKKPENNEQKDSSNENNPDEKEEERITSLPPHKETRADIKAKKASRIAEKTTDLKD